MVGSRFFCEAEESRVLDIHVARDGTITVMLVDFRRDNLCMVPDCGAKLCWVATVVCCVNLVTLITPL